MYYSVYTIRQASRRSWHIGQTRPVKVVFMAYRNTFQADALKLVAKKLQSSQAVEGELPEDGLAAYGDGGDGLMMAPGPQDRQRRRGGRDGDGGGVQRPFELTEPALVGKQNGHGHLPAVVQQIHGLVAVAARVAESPLPPHHRRFDLAAAQRVEGTGGRGPLVEG